MDGTHVYVACAAGFADERIEPSVVLVDALKQAQGPRYLVYETLGERTLALAQLDRAANPGRGYAPRLAAFMRPVLADCVANGIRIVGNFGMANPRGAARLIRDIAAELGIQEIRIAVVEGDDLLQVVSQDEIRSWPIMEGLPLGDRPLIAANAYLGAEGIVQALELDADVVVTGRCTDSALFLGPLRHEFGWTPDDWNRLASGVLVGHLLECSAQVTGGYFGDPGYKDVPDPARIGYPIAEVTVDGRAIITKPVGSGGLVSPRTVKEQLLYEVFNPASYLTPDVVADFSEVTVTQVGPDRVCVEGARGRERPATLKATVSVESGFLGEGEITYAGPNALRRADMAAGILAERLKICGITAPTRIDIIGTLSTFDSDGGSLRRRANHPADGDYRVRLAGKSHDRAVAEAIAQEVISLYSAGPAGGGGVRKAVTSRVETGSVLVPRDKAVARVGLV